MRRNPICGLYLACYDSIDTMSMTTLEALAMPNFLHHPTLLEGFTLQWSHTLDRALKAPKAISPQTNGLLKKDDKFLLFQDKQQYKNLYKHYFEGCLDISGNLKPQKVKIVEEFFYDVFTTYNVQMWGMLASKKLVYGTENAMNKMATDIVYRLVLNSHHCLKAD